MTKRKLHRNIPLVLALVAASQGCGSSPTRGADGDAGNASVGAHDASTTWRDASFPADANTGPGAGDAGGKGGDGEVGGDAMANDHDAAASADEFDESDPCPLVITFPRAVSDSTSWSCYGRVHTMAAFSVYNTNDHPITIELEVDGTLRDTLLYPVEAGWQPRRLFLPQGTHSYTFRVGGPLPGSFQVANLYGANEAATPALDGKILIGGESIPPELSGAWLVDDFASHSVGPTIHPPALNVGEEAVMNVDCSAFEHTHFSLQGLVSSSTAGEVDLAIDGVFHETLDFSAGDGDYSHTIDVPAGPHTYTLTARATSDHGAYLALARLTCQAD